MAEYYVLCALLLLALNLNLMYLSCHCIVNPVKSVLKSNLIHVDVCRK